mgnify:FL=1
MISTLHIKNIGIIDDLVVNLNNGLNILTGETGAGKTLIIDSLQIATGGRFSKDMIRRGEECSFVELALYLPENENSIDGNIIVSREIHSNGRNSCKVNGRLVTVNELKSFMKNLIDIHGQMDNQSILDQTMHIKYLDDFIGKKIKTIKDEYLEYYKGYCNVKSEIKSNFGDEKEKQRKLDLLRYQVNEIESASLKMGEDVEVENIRERMINSEKIRENLNEVNSEIGDTTIDSVSNAIRALEKVEIIDNKYSETLNTLKGVYYDLQELSRDVKAFQDEMDFDEAEKQKIEERYDLIHDLKRKYGNSIEEILKYKEEISTEIEKIENSEEYIAELKKKLNKIIEKMKNLSDQINKIRREYAIELEKNINKELFELEMPNAKFKISIKKNDEEIFWENGQDQVEFLISTNVGEEEKELIKIASGGEMSRIMLAIKNVLANVDEVPVMIFDEIDTGISGKAAKSVGEKLKQISKTHQVICITHQANIAAKGDYNYYISKRIDNGRTLTNIKQLNEEETIKEIARISSGEYTKAALEHAKELRK